MKFEKSGFGKRIHESVVLCAGERFRRGLGFVAALSFLTLVALVQSAKAASAFRLELAAEAGKQGLVWLPVAASLTSTESRTLAVPRELFLSSDSSTSLTSTLFFYLPHVPVWEVRLNIRHTKQVTIFKVFSSEIGLFWHHTAV